MLLTTTKEKFNKITDAVIRARSFSLNSRKNESRRNSRQRFWPQSGMLGKKRTPAKQIRQTGTNFVANTI